jgi:hypothetical protein
MPRRVQRRRCSWWRELLIARRGRDMERWRIPAHVYPYEEFLNSSADVVVTRDRLAQALAHAGQVADRFDDGGPDAGKVWLLGADDTLTLIEDRHVAEMAQCDVDDLVDGTGPLRYQVGDAYDHGKWWSGTARGQPRSEPGSASEQRLTANPSARQPITSLTLPLDRVSLEPILMSFDCQLCC